MLHVVSHRAQFWDLYSSCCTSTKTLNRVSASLQMISLYRKINSNIDHQLLQTDLIQLEKWSDKWQMQFNISKCVHLPITNKTKPSSHQYSLFGHPLSKVTSHAYLGVKLVVDSKLSWAKHITEIIQITTKSSKVLGMVKRTLDPWKPEAKYTAYNMLVRPKREYASPIWNLHTSSQINRLEKFNNTLPDL